VSNKSYRRESFSERRRRDMMEGISEWDAFFDLYA